MTLLPKISPAWSSLTRAAPRSAATIAAAVELLRKRKLTRIRRFGSAWLLSQGGTTVALDRLPLVPGPSLDVANHPAFFAGQPLPGDFVVQIGAGMGEEIALLSRAVGRAGTVVAIEAHPETFCVLVEVVHRNQLENVVPICAAVGPNSPTIRIESSGAAIANQIGAEAGALVPVLRIRDILDASGRADCDFMMINIEGAETQVIEQILADQVDCRSIVVSCHDFRADRGDGEHFRTAEACHKMLTGAGFELRTNDSGADWERSWAHAAK